MLYLYVLIYDCNKFYLEVDWYWIAFVIMIYLLENYLLKCTGKMRRRGVYFIIQCFRNKPCKRLTCRASCASSFYRRGRHRRAHIQECMECALFQLFYIRMRAWKRVAFQHLHRNARGDIATTFLCHIYIWMRAV